MKINSVFALCFIAAASVSNAADDPVSQLIEDAQSAARMHPEAPRSDATLESIDNKTRAEVIEAVAADGRVTRPEHALLHLWARRHPVSQ